MYIDHKTLYTGVNESFQTIQSAINAASSGMTVVVRDGLYVENIFVDKELTIISENGYTSCIIESSNSDLDVIELSHSNVIFKGFSILGVSGDYNAPIYGELNYPPPPQMVII